MPGRTREPRLVANGVVRGEDKQDRVGSVVALAEHLQGSGDSGRGVPADRLEQDGERCDAGGGKLPHDHKPVRLVRDHDGRANGARQRHDPPDGRLKEGALVREGDKLLGMELPGKRPEPASGPARQHDGEYGGNHVQDRPVLRSDWARHSLPKDRRRPPSSRRFIETRSASASSRDQPTGTTSRIGVIVTSGLR